MSIQRELLTVVLPVLGEYARKLHHNDLRKPAALRVAGQLQSFGVGIADVDVAKAHELLLDYVARFMQLGVPVPERVDLAVVKACAAMQERGMVVASPEGPSTSRPQPQFEHGGGALVANGEVPGNGLPDFPDWCQTFRERKAYQVGIADARAIAESEVAADSSGVGRNERSGAVVPAVSDELRQLVEGLLEYAERYADLNGEPPGGNCRAFVVKGRVWLEGHRPGLAAAPGVELDGVGVPDSDAGADVHDVGRASRPRG